MFQKVALFNLEGTGDSMGCRRAGERNQEMKAMCRIDALAVKVEYPRQCAFA